MEGRRAGLAFHFFCILFAGHLARASSQLQVISTDNNQPFLNPDRITVGSSSDLVVQVRCISQDTPSEEEEAGGGIVWRYRVNGSEVDMGLRAFGTSQENGVLRVYPVNVLTGEGAMFQCTDGNTTLNVTFDLLNSLFFINPIPPTISRFEDRLGLCQVPDIPSANVSVVNETNSLTGREFIYCRVETRRGVFRSRSVILLPAPTFIYEPVNITASPINGTATAAFSCAVSPAAGLVQIQWFYEMMSFGSGGGSGMGLGPGLTSGLLTNISEGVTIEQPSGSGTSVLVLESVDNGHEGFYSCSALFSDGTTLNSSEASLTFNRTSLGNDDVIILAPPTFLSVTEGDTVSVPCVGSRGAFPTFSPDGALTTSTQYSLNFDPISASSASDYVCQVGDSTANFTIIVTVIDRPSTDGVVLLRPLMPYSPEVITDDFRFTCPRMPSAQWLLNGLLFFSGPNLNLFNIVGGGIYQCVGVVGGQPETDFTGQSASDVYLLIPAVGNTFISITPNLPSFIFGEDVNVTLNCSLSGNPLPLIEWSREDESLDGAQAATGFMETSFSTLSLNTTELGVGTHIFICNATVETSTTAPMSPSIAAQVAITVEPLLQNISVAPEMLNFVLDDNPNMTVLFNCSVEANPLPAIEWRVDGELVQEGPVTPAGGQLFTSSLTLTLGQLGPGVHSVLCLARPDVENVTTNISDEATVTIYTPPTFITNPQSVTVVVGDLVSLNCSAQATPPPYITWVFSDGNGTEVAVVDDVIFNISISQGAGDEVTSVLTFIADSAMAGSNTFFCVANNSITSIQSNTSIVTIQSFPMFLVDPESTIAISGDLVMLNCSVEATPFIPTITWLDRNGEKIVEDKAFHIMEIVLGDVVSSTLTFTATSENRTENGSTFQCVARVVVEAIDRNLTEESEQANLTIAGVPGSPSPVFVDDITSRTALVTWQPSFSLIDITNYSVSVSEITLDAESAVIRGAVPVGGNLTALNLTVLLRPFRQYRVSVVAINRAGRGEIATSQPFNTSEDAPDGSPTINSLSSTLLRQVDIRWQTVEPDLQNGIILNYTVQLQVLSGSGSGIIVTVGGLFVTLTATNGIEAGVVYNVSIAANTRVGRGPFSTGLTQGTIQEPLVIPTDRPITVDQGRITDTTLLITLPSISGAGPDSFSHFWVIAMKPDVDFSLDRSPTDIFPDNSSFSFYSDDLPLNTPYIVAEIDASRITGPTNFLLGNETATATLNDVRGYRNGPLTPGTPYTVFMWGFPPSVANSVKKRQVGSSPRQYNVFSTSPFSSRASTASIFVGLAAGAVAGVVIAIILFFISLVALVIAVVLYMRWRVKTEYIPPPSRKGSMRLRDRREIILQDSSTASLIKNSRADSELQQLTPDDVRLPVSVEEFPGYCKMMHANSDHLFSEEYEILQIKSPSLPHIQCSMPHNVHKNRYANINCYDESRVHMSLMPGVEGSDYINANYIDGYQRKCAYVATQGPLPNTTYDFWRMVWEMNSCCVIMLTNLVEKSRAKCHQYWPEVGSLSLGDLTVMLIEVQQLAYYTIRTFRLSRGNDRREVKQFHYTGWPDFGVPDHPNPVIAFIRRLANFKRTTDGPDIVHCSAGVGRTGTLVSIQSMMQMVSEEGKIDIFNFVLGMRRQRNYMVQTERQYIFLHDAMIEILKLGDTEITIQNLRRRYKELLAQDPNTESSKMEAEFTQLKELDSVDESQFQAAKMPVNLPKNRYQNILPYERYRVRLLLHPGVSGSDYINASYIDGYQQRHQYIVTQGPMKDTVDDFWRMVWEHRASTIMMLCQLEEKGKEQCVRYWPNEKIRQHGDMFVELTQVTEFATYTMREFSITNTKINESRMIKQYQYTDWLGDQEPSNAAAIIDLIGVLQKSQHNNGGGPIIVHDNTSIGRSGTFCVLSSVLEQLKVEGIVDPFFTIHSLRQQQPGLVQTFDQYKFCYQAVIEFLDSFDHYANFD